MREPLEEPPQIDRRLDRPGPRSGPVLGDLLVDAGLDLAGHVLGEGLRVLLALDPFAQGAFSGQLAPQRDAHEHHDDREGQSHEDGHGLQGLHALLRVAHPEHDGRDGARQRGEGEPDPQRRVRIAARGHHRHDVRAGVRGRDEEDDEDEHGQDGQPDRHRHVVEGLEQGDVRVDRAVGADEVLVAEHLLVEAVPAEDGEPDEGDEGGDEEHADDELAHRPAAGDPRDEDPDEGRPAYPPPPVVQRPVRQPLRARLPGERQGLQRDVDDLVEEVAEVGYEFVGQEERGAEDRHGGHEDRGDDEVEVGQELDPRVQAGGHGDGRQAGDDDDEPHEHPVRRLPSGEVLRSARQLFDAEAQRHGDPEDRADDGDDVDDVADAALDAVAEDRLERPPHRDRHALAVHGVGDGQSDDDVDRPGVQPPVEEGRVHGVARRVGARSRARGLHAASGPGEVVVLEGFGRPPEDEADAHSRGEEHREPGSARVLGLGVVRPEHGVPLAGHGHDQGEDDESRHREDVAPPGVLDDHRGDVRDHGVGALGFGGRQEDEDEYERDRGPEDRRGEVSRPFDGCWLRHGRSPLESAFLDSATLSKRRGKSKTE